MKYFVTICKKKYEVSIKKKETGILVMFDGKEFVVDFWRDPGSPFVFSS